MGSRNGSTTSSDDDHPTPRRADSGLIENGGTASLVLDAASTHSLQSVRRWVDLVLGAATTIDVQLVISELVTNALQHGSGGPISVGLAFEVDLAVAVSNPALRAPEVQHQLGMSARGRGLAIALATASQFDIGFEDGTATVTCVFADHRRQLNGNLNP